MSADGGTPVQITKHGGVKAMESADGRTLYSAKDISAPGTWKIPAGGGEEVLLFDAPEAGRWGQVALTNSGLYYLGRDGDSTQPPRFAIFFYNFASRQTTRIALLAKSPSLTSRGLALSPDGRSLLFNQVEATGADLMLLETFR